MPPFLTYLYFDLSNQDVDLEQLQLSKVKLSLILLTFFL